MLLIGSPYILIEQSVNHNDRHALYPADAKTSSELIEAADKALYQAKSKGRNQVVMFSEITS